MHPALLRIAFITILALVFPQVSSAGDQSNKPAPERGLVKELLQHAEFHLERGEFGVVDKILRHVPDEESEWLPLDILFDEDLEKSNKENAGAFDRNLSDAQRGDAKAQYEVSEAYRYGRGTLYDEEKARTFLVASAGNGYSRAQVVLGTDLQRGFLGFEQNPERAIYWFERAAAQGDTAAHVALGQAYEEGKGVKQSFDQAILNYQSAFERGSTDGAYRLGALYLAGWGVDQDIPKGVDLLRIAADGQHISANYKLGLMHKNGDFVPKDLEKAVGHFRIASKWDNDAKVELALAILEGRGIEQDLGLAEKLLKEAVDNNSGFASYHYGKMHENGIGVGVNKNYARTLYERAVGRGFEEAVADLQRLKEEIAATHPEDRLLELHDASKASGQYHIGQAYLTGSIVEKNFSKAAEWFRKAADQGLPQAEIALASLYLSGTGVEKDLRRAFSLWESAAHRGSAAARFHLGEALENGIGVEIDLKQAVYWYREAVKQDFWPAKSALARLYYNGKGVPQDYKRSLELYRESGERWDRVAQYNVGVHYEFGYGVSRNLKEAFKWYSKSYSNGFKPAQDKVNALEPYIRQEEEVILKLIASSYWSNYKGMLEIAQDLVSLDSEIGYYQIGHMYESGLGVTADVSIAIKNYAAASERGSKQADAALARLKRQ